MKEKPSARSPRTNIITVGCLSLVTLGAPFCMLTEYTLVPTLEFIRPGVIVLSGGNLGLFITVTGYILVSMWSLISLSLSLVAYRRNKQDGKKSIMWALLLFGVNIFVIWYLFALGATCVPLYPGGSSEAVACTLPVLPRAAPPALWP